MAGFILGEKTIQKQVFTQDGKRMPVTYINTTDCFLIDVKTPEKNKYYSAKIGFKQSKNIRKSIQGEAKKAGIKTPLRFFKEIRLDNLTDKIKPFDENKKIGLDFGEKKIFIGESIKPIDIFKQGDLVDVSGKSKGKGFQGGVKRHGFRGGPKTHGQSDRLRGPGSIGQTTTPGRVYKGKRMAGRMGAERVTVKHLKVYEVFENGLFLTGLIPGGKNTFLEIRTSKTYK